MKTSQAAFLGLVAVAGYILIKKPSLPRGPGSIHVTSYYGTLQDPITGVAFTVAPGNRSGVTPATLTDVPEGDYVVSGTYQGIDDSDNIHVSSGQVAEAQLLFIGPYLGNILSYPDILSKA